LPGLLKRGLGRLFGRPHRRTRKPAPTDPALEARAASVVGRHAEERATLFERAERLAGKSLRLDEAGMPSESAGNRADRAREEVEAGLATVRASFVASEGAGGGEAFDREILKRYPALGLKLHGRNA